MSSNDSEAIFAPRVLSGVQPSGSLHLGNYFGAIKQHIELQYRYPGESFYFIADYHALTTVRDREVLRKQSWNVALDYLALGLDPDKATFYRQSDLPQVCELMWILSCVTGKGLLDRGHAFKDKVSKGLQASVGLFLYPELMAADILLPRATLVPVGEDQGQHLEMTRDIAASFNSSFEVDMFPLPSTILNEASVVPGIDGRKMSKSYENTIPVFCNREELERLTSAIKTSSSSLGSPLNPEGDTVFALYRLVAEQEQVEELGGLYRSGGIGYRDAKARLRKVIEDYFAAAAERRRELEGDLDSVEDILRQGARRIRKEADDTLSSVREIVGLGKYERAWGPERFGF